VTRKKSAAQGVGPALPSSPARPAAALPLAYQFFARRVEDNGGFLVAQAWGPSAGVTLAPTVAGTYQVAVWVRSAGGSAAEAGAGSGTVLFSAPAPAQPRVLPCPSPNKT